MTSQPLEHALQPTAREIILPNDWVPRRYQLPLWTHMERRISVSAERGWEGLGARAVCIWHRRAGKDMTMLHFLATQMMRRVGTYWHVFPTQKQAKKAIWEGKDRTGKPFLNAFPEELRVRQRDDELAIWFPPPAGYKEGSMYQLCGVENVDSLLGTNPVGIVFSEYSLPGVDFEIAWQLTQPILLENGGWAIFIFTPRGHNQGYRLWKLANNDEHWFSQKLTVDDTGAVPLALIDEQRKNTPEEIIQQEYWCSFEAPLVGSYYGEQISKMDRDGRLCKVPHEASLPVDTFWDLGYDDNTVVLFHQSVGPERRILDLVQNQGAPIDWYVRQLLQERQYTYGRHYVPHDAEAHSIQTGKTLVQQLRKLGLRNIHVVEKSDLQTGITATRSMLSSLWIDSEKCELLIRALQEYRKRPLKGVTDPDGNPLFGSDPLHDWSSNFADALRTGAMGFRPRRGPRDESEGELPRVLAPKTTIV